MAPIRAALVCAGIVFVGVTAASAGFPGTNGKIVFDSAVAPPPRQIFSMNANGGGRLQLTNDPAGGYFASGSPDGRKIAFTRCAADCDIYVMNADGSGETELLRGRRHERRRKRPKEPHPRDRQRLHSGLVSGRDEDRLQGRRAVP